MHGSFSWGSRVSFFCGSSSSSSLLYFSLWFSVAGGSECFAGIVTGLLRDHVHFFFQRRKALHDFVNSQRHVADGFDLAARLRRKTAGFEQQEIGVAQHRGQRIVQAVAHFEHVTSEGGLAVERGAGLLGGAGAGFGARAVHSFAGGENQSFDPGAFAGNFFVIAAQDRDAGPAIAYALLGSRVLTGTENRPRGGMQRLEHDRKQIAPEFIDDRDVEGIDDEARPQLTAQQGEGGHGALGLPARGHAAREVGIVGDDEYGRGFHGCRRSSVLGRWYSVLSAW